MTDKATAEAAPLAHLLDGVEFVPPFTNSQDAIRDGALIGTFFFDPPSGFYFARRMHNGELQLARPFPSAPIARAYIVSAKPGAWVNLSADCERRIARQNLAPKSFVPVGPI